MTDTAPPSPQAVMMQLVNGQLVSRAIGVVAELGIADRLADGPRTSAELAEATATNPDALYRVLRMLAGLEVFGVRPDRRVENTSLSDTLRSDTPGSVRHYARWFGTSLHWRAVGDLDHSVGTGEPSLVKDQPDKNAFEVLAADPTAQATFNDAMTGLSSADAQAIAGAYDFARFGRIVDVGGDHAALAQGIAAVAPDAQITVFDLPHVIEGTDHRLAETTGGDRITTRTGSFFDGVPGAFDLCVMKHIIHDWDDARASTILTNCRNALEGDGRVVVCEMVVSDGPAGLPALVMDIEMLLGPGGRERTREEFAALFETAGLRLERVIATRTAIRLLEARPA